ncbi:MAG: DUF4476 domain-containing protein [Bacteroidales bacterium]|nr:DUF4476 domain-containing protein [Bacteroidales bacterium]
MRYLTAISLFLHLCLATTAQTGNLSVTKTPPPVHYGVNFVSQHGEAFNVYIDGNLQNRLPLGRVLVTEVTDQVHEVVVILKRPVEKAAVLQLRPNEKVVTVNVNYDARLGELYLYTAARNRPDTEERNALREEARRVVTLDSETREPEQEAVAEEVPFYEVTPDGLDSMLLRMRSLSFDNERLALGKVIVASSHLTAAQIARLAESIDFSNSQVEFLKYAYGYCIDPANYYRTIDVLTFTSDKRKVLDYIATQK